MRNAGIYTDENNDGGRWELAQALRCAVKGEIFKDGSWVSWRQCRMLREYQDSLAKPFNLAPRVVTTVIAGLIQQLDSFVDPDVCARSFSFRCTSALFFIRCVC